MSLTLTAAIAQCPRSLFGDKDKGLPPKYPQVFAKVTKALLKDAGEKFDEATVDLVASYINPSSLQRAIADHRASITGIFDRKSDSYRPVPEPQPKKERGKVRPKAKAAKDDEDDLGLGKSTKVGKLKGKAKKLTQPAKNINNSGKDTREVGTATTKAGKKAEAAAKEARTAETPAEAASKPVSARQAERLKRLGKTVPAKPASAPEARKPAGGKLDALAAARAALAAKKAAKEASAKAPKSEAVEI